MDVKAFTSLVAAFTDTNEQLSEGQNNTSHYLLFVSFLFIEIFPVIFPTI